jgi:putative ABC transport system permease protein
MQARSPHEAGPGPADTPCAGSDREKTARMQLLGTGQASAWRRLAAWGAGLLLLATAATAGAWWLRERGLGAAAPRYVTEPVRRGDLAVRVIANGTSQPTRSVGIGSELSGTCVLVDINDRVRKGQRLGPGPGGPGAPGFVEADLEVIATQVGGVRAVAPEVRAAVAAVAGARNWSTAAIGTTAACFDVARWQLAGGRAFDPAEERAGGAVCLIGATVRRELFGADAPPPLGERLRLRQVSCEVIGLLAAKGQAAMGQDQDDIVVLPLRTVQRRLTGSPRIQTLLVSAHEGSDTARVVASLRQLLRERRRLAGDEEDNFNVLDTRQIAETLSGTTQILTTLLGAVAAVSLLVGGIGIMNIMLVGVTGRTREIGVRLAIGALEREVPLQFLIDAVVLAAAGGLLGVLLALGTSLALSAALSLPFQFLPGINLLALCFAAAVGIVFGYFPARSAAPPDPIEALRHDHE